jgi:TonB family protein
MLIARTAALSALTLAFSSPASAQSAPAAAASSAAPKARWSIDYGVQRCSLFRGPEGASGMMFGVRIIPGNSPEILFTRDSFKPLGLDLAARATLVLLPSGERFEAGVAWTSLADGRQVMMMDGVRSGFIDALAQSSGLALEARGKKGFELAFSGTAAAVKALHDCNEALMKDWGVDYLIRKGTKLPEAIGGPPSWFSDEDYPRSSITKSSSGTVVAGLDIAEDGRLTACTVLATSGDKALDDRTCAVFMKRARYKPARDPSGKPIKMRIAQTLHWVMR